MIVIGLINGKYCPQIVCDICGTVITNCGLAAVVHKQIINEDDIRKIMHVHKQYCLDDIEKKLGRIGWHEMTDHFVHLLDNINFAVTAEQLDIIKNIELSL